MPIKTPTWEESEFLASDPGAAPVWQDFDLLDGSDDTTGPAEFGKSLVRGGVSAAASLPRGAGHIADYLRTKTGGPNALDLDVGGDQSALLTLADSMEQWAQDVVPQVGERTFLRHSFPEGLGQIVPLIAGGAAAKGVTKLATKEAMKVAEGAAEKGLLKAGRLPAIQKARQEAIKDAATGTVATQGGLMEFTDAFDREIERQKEAGEVRNADKAMLKSGLYAVFAGGVEARFGAGRLLEKYGAGAMKKAAEELAKRGVSRQLLRKTFGDVFVGGVEEGVQQIGQDLIVEGKPNWPGIVESTAVGGLVQGTVGAPANVAGAVLGRQPPAPPAGGDVVPPAGGGVVPPVTLNPPAPPAGQQDFTINPETQAVARFKGTNGEAIEVVLGQASLEQVIDMTARQHPGAKFTGTDFIPVPANPAAEAAEKAGLTQTAAELAQPEAPEAPPRDVSAPGGMPIPPSEATPPEGPEAAPTALAAPAASPTRSLTPAIKAGETVLVGKPGESHSKIMAANGTAILMSGDETATDQANWGFVDEAGKFLTRAEGASVFEQVTGKQPARANYLESQDLPGTAFDPAKAAPATPAPNAEPAPVAPASAPLVFKVLGKSKPLMGRIIYRVPAPGTGGETTITVPQTTPVAEVQKIWEQRNQGESPTAINSDDLTVLDRVAQATPAEWLKMAQQLNAAEQGGGFSKVARALGRQAPNQAFVDQLVRWRDDFNTRAEAALAQEDFVSAQGLATQKQFFNEAYEAATGTGSAVQAFTSPKGSNYDANYKPPFPTEPAPAPQPAPVPAALEAETLQEPAAPPATTEESEQAEVITNLMREDATPQQQAAVDQATDAAEARLDAAAKKTRGINPRINPQGGQGGFVPLSIIHDLVLAGARVLQRGGQWTMTQSQWTAAMVKRFGRGIARHLAQVWNYLGRLQAQASLRLSTRGQRRVNQITALATRTNTPPERIPVADEISGKGQPGLLMRMAPINVRVRELGSARLAQQRTESRIEEAQAGQAVRVQSDHLWNQLLASARQVVPLHEFHLPMWIIGTRRAKAFKNQVLHIAAYLHATGRDAFGNFTFKNFEARAGTMTLATAKKSMLQPGDTFTHRNQITQQPEQLKLGQVIRLPDGRQFHQVTRPMTAPDQRELYDYYKAQYPEMIWFLDMFIDPALAKTRQTINDVEIPVFNRFALAAMMAQNHPEFSPVTGYTPDVLITRSLLGSIGAALSFRGGTRSAGRRYKTGRSREGGHVRDILSGFNVRSWQLLVEQSRQRWMRAVRDAAKPFSTAEPPSDWVELSTGMKDLWTAVRRLRNWSSPVDPLTQQPIFPETEARLTDDSSEEYKAFLGEVYALRGEKLMLPKALVDELIRAYGAQVTHGKLYRLGAWLTRNTKQMFLAMPLTYVANILTNDVFTLETAHRFGLAGLLKGSPQDLRFARNLMVSEMAKFFPGLRMLTDGKFRRALQVTLNPAVWAEGTDLADLRVRYDDKPLDMLRQGELGAAVLQTIRYGNIDIRSKQRMAYAWLRAMAVTQAKKNGLRGRALRSDVDAYLAKPPPHDVARAVDIANFELLNYADTPNGLADFQRNHEMLSNLTMPFIRFGYHYVAKNAQRAAGLRRLLARVPKQQRADAFADFVTFVMFPAGGAGIVAGALAAALNDDDDDENRLIGTSFVKGLDDEGEVTSKPIDRTLNTRNRINLSAFKRMLAAWAGLHGLGTDNEDDYWLRVRNFPVIAMAGAAFAAQRDTARFGPKEGARTYLTMVKDLATDFFSIGMAAKVPFKAEKALLSNQPNAPTLVDPYAANVPLLAYVTDQTLDSFLPGSRQFDLIVRWLDPIQRRRTTSKTLFYDPGLWDAARVGHLTGILDRIFNGEAGSLASTLPPEGPINRRTGAVQERSITERQRIAEIFGFNVKPINRAEYDEAISAK